MLEVAVQDKVPLHRCCQGMHAKALLWVEQDTHCICCSWPCTSFGRDSKVDALVKGTCCGCWGCRRRFAEPYPGCLTLAMLLRYLLLR